MVKTRPTLGVKPALAVLAAVAGVMTAAPQAAADTPGNYGVWRNPKNSVHLELKGCGSNTCGYVVWANEAAKADARKNGKDLVGMQLLRDFVKDKNGNWRGKVYVPDLNMTFAGTAEYLDPATLKAKGCIIGGLLCKSQTWRRVDLADAR